MLTMMTMEIKNRNLIPIILVLIVGIIFSLFIAKKIVSTHKPTRDIIFAPFDGSLAGEYTCLPHKDTEGPQTEECAFGIKTNRGNYYAIDFQNDEMIADFQAGKSAQLTGRVTPIEVISSDRWMRYQVKGIISVE